MHTGHWIRARLHSRGQAGTYTMARGCSKRREEQIPDSTPPVTHQIHARNYHRWETAPAQSQPVTRLEETEAKNKKRQMGQKKGRTFSQPTPSVHPVSLHSLAHVQPLSTRRENLQKLCIQRKRYTPQPRHVDQLNQSYDVSPLAQPKSQRNVRWQEFSSSSNHSCCNIPKAPPTSSTTANSFTEKKTITCYMK